MSNADRVQLSYMKEVTFGVTPSATALQILRFTGESLTQESSTKDSDEIRSDRQVNDVVRTGFRAMGDINLELSYAAYDDLVLAVLGSAAWSTPVSINGVNISASSVDNSISSASNAFTTINIGQWVKVTGFTGNDAVNNGYYKVTSKPGTPGSKLILSGKAVVTASAGASVTVNMGAQAVNGVVETSFSIERQMVDLTTTRQAYRGMTVGSLKLNAVTEQLLTGGFSFLGVRETNETSSIGNAYTAAPVNTVMNVVDNVLSIIYDATGTYTDVPTTEFSFTMDNNLRGRTQLGDGGPVSIGEGNFKANGTLKGYFSSNADFARYLNFQDVALAMVVEDVAGNAYVFDFPACKLTAAKRNASSSNSDVMRDMNWSAKRSGGEGVTARVARF